MSRLEVISSRGSSKTLRAPPPAPRHHRVVARSEQRHDLRTKQLDDGADPAVEHVGVAPPLRREPIQHRITSSARYQVSPVTQRLVVNSRIGSPRGSTAIATRWLTSSRVAALERRRLGGGAGTSATANSGRISGATPDGMPSARRKMWKWPCSRPRLPAAAGCAWKKYWAWLCGS